jgi:hypothetical protein
LQPGLDINQRVTEKGVQLMQKNTGSFGPHVLVISDSDTDDHTVYAVIQGGLFYEAQSIIHAVDICLKATFVFGLSFPLPARSSWTFLQKAVFGLSTADDFNSIKLAELMAWINSRDATHGLDSR